MQTSITIYGAQMVAVSVYYAIKELYSECRIQCFLVKEQAGNPYAIDGIPVLTLDKYQETHIKVLIATPENHHPAIIRDLEAKGIKDHLCMDSQKEAALMERYYEKRIPDFTCLSGRKQPGRAFYIYVQILPGSAFKRGLSDTRLDLSHSGRGSADRYPHRPDLR